MTSSPIHPGALARIRELLVPALATIRVDNNRFLDWSSLDALRTLDDVLPGHSQDRQRLDAMLGDTPLFDFLTGSLTRTLLPREYDANAAETYLVRIAEYSDVDALADRLLSDLNALPHHYMLLFELPEALSGVLGIGMSDGYRALSGDVSLANGYRLGDFPAEPEELARARTLMGSPLSPNPQRIYLCISIAGFVAPFTITPPVQAAHSRLRAICGFLIAHRALMLGFRSLWGPFRRRVLVYRDDSAWQFVEAHELDLKTSDALSRLAPDNPIADTIRIQVIAEAVRDVSTLLHLGDKADTVLKGCQWLFDSYSDESDLLGFVQAMVAVEILVGDKASSDLVGLGELLSNRCAYLIGTSYRDRTQLRDDFRRIYKTRSRIVHSGHNQLTQAERKDLSHLRWMCHRVIQQEVRLLKAEPRLLSAR